MDEARQTEAQNLSASCKAGWQAPRLPVGPVSATPIGSKIRLRSFWLALDQVSLWP